MKAAAMKARKKNMSQNAAMATVAAAALLLACAALAGCGLVTNSAVDTPRAMPGPALHGIAMGGRQPIGGATLYLFAASMGGGYGSASSSRLPAGTVTGPDGSFNITGQYNCYYYEQMYLVALGGDTGAGNNPQSGLMAALGSCSALSSTQYISVNEITTVGSVFALAPFMAGYASIGTSTGNSTGLFGAFTNASKLVDITRGVAGGPSLAPGATAPVTEINTLANVLASCINTGGGVSGDNSICGSLFAYATASGGTAPTNTIDLAMLIAKNPAYNTAAEYNYSAPTSPYAPVLSTAPNDWTMSINYTRGFSGVKSVAVDGANNVWIANSNSNTVTELTQSGLTAQVLTGNGLSTPSNIAIDANGDAFVTNVAGNSVSAFTPYGSVLAGSPFAVGTGPVPLAFDAAGNLFVGDLGAGTVSVLSPSGSIAVTFSNGTNAPSAIAIDPK